MSERIGDSISELPAKSKGDVAHALAKAGLSLIPIAGGSAVELFQLLVQPPLEKRREEWMQAVGERLQQLEEHGLKLEDLQTNEQFVSAVMYVTQAAMRTHVVAKREALCNAILNVAVGQAPDETVQYLLLSFIDDLTEMHLRILKVFHQPTVPQGISMGGLSTVLEQAIPDLRNRRDVYDQLWKDLYARGLVNTEGLHFTMSGSGLASRRTTGLGEALLQFISAPNAL
ncbi:MAG: hypothetical protein E6Q59_03265 [Nitrosomonas sp.]|nr:hypothetical protein [Nitrosomonas sp.]OQW84710.1 MAG: hypothetical protein BVN30_02375 [Proteobacteria bacterium ST_bin16]TXI40635.1 MAG: hypothetical protein E6Q59_03265 [Nitrosomonas sp.]